MNRLMKSSALLMRSAKMMKTTSVSMSQFRRFLETYTPENVPVPFPESLDETSQKLACGVLNQKRALLSRAVTLMESHHPKHIQQAEDLLDYILKARRHINAIEHPHEFVPGSFRIGIAGPPGAGKSTFIEAFGTMLCKQGHKVAVLAIDPSSTRSGGSILGDKTRMLELSYHPNAFVRPSPSQCNLGGVAEHTSDLVLLCEAAGYDIVIVETVGLGQSEVQVDDMVDMLMLLMPPAMGDELQGFKKGIMEHADMVVINKADGALANVAMRSEQENRRAVQLQRPKYPFWECEVTRCSAIEKTGIERVWKICSDFRDEAMNNNAIEEKRIQQNEASMWAQLFTQVLGISKSSEAVNKKAIELEEVMKNGGITHRKAGRLLMETLFNSYSKQ
ncbi:hypothetical protein WA158_000097 [Blastocystis sp. Blastoise]